jgi:hypothetical protein
MAALAGRYDPQELNRIGFRLYESFRPEVSESVQGWGTNEELWIGRIRDAAARRECASLGGPNGKTGADTRD